MSTSASARRDDRTTNRPFAWVQSGQYSKAHSLFVRGRRFTTIAVMCSTGVVALRIVEGAATREIFTSFFYDEVVRWAWQVPKLQVYSEQRSVVVFDNCAIHSKDDLEGACEVNGLQCLFLPPYSPIYNPIEKLFEVIKRWIQNNRGLVCRMPPADAIHAAFASVTPTACANRIRAVYMYDTPPM
ncbi:hypothetical protein TSOC_011507 [Tetrabaena socialis]|uniref:Tc1-like transposase DDE domain-containing protein n=1 Tax=Tetrabaena socialis TaxID=47790 RepID=A0A2J7ZQG3_9CHLO|nr:hypothetical protein TSOC_011507 [Tetrabaena socialis]|eukprot:PNH02507.1 hypothetical protein TSOC_011507 [Tetrabaena socialis]